MKPSREEVEQAIRQAGWTGIYSHWTSPTDKESLTVPVEQDQIERFAAAMYEAGAAAERKTAQEAEAYANKLYQGVVNVAEKERAASDKLEKALREYDRLIGYQYSGSRPAMTALANAAQNGARAIAEVEELRRAERSEDMRKEQE